MQTALIGFRGAGSIMKPLTPYKIACYCGGKASVLKARPVYRGLRFKWSYAAAITAARLWRWVMGKRIRQTVVGGVGLAAGVGGGGGRAAPPDWSKVPAKSVKLFYPGQSTYEWLVGPEHKKNAYKKVVQGEACLSCHEGEEADIGKKTSSGQRLEPNKLDGKQPVIDLKVQAAYDNKNLYWRFQWKTKNNYPGSAYPFYRFDGKEDRKSTRLNSSHGYISYAVFCLKKNKN